MKKIKNYLLSLSITFVIAPILLCVSAAIFAYTSIEDRHLQIFVFGIVLISNMIGAAFLCKKEKEKGILHGALFGILYCALIYLISTLCFTGILFSNMLLIYVGICIVSGIVGGIVGVNI